MANNVAMQAMYLRLGFSAAAGTLLIDAQGMDTLVELRILKDEEVRRNFSESWGRREEALGHRCRQPKDRSADARSISVLASAVDKLEVAKEKEKVDNDKSTEVLTNINNSALTRIETGQKKGTADWHPEVKIIEHVAPFAMAPLVSEKSRCVQLSMYYRQKCTCNSQLWQICECYRLWPCTWKCEGLSRLSLPQENVDHVTQWFDDSCSEVRWVSITLRMTYRMTGRLSSNRVTNKEWRVTGYSYLQGTTRYPKNMLQIILRWSMDILRGPLDITRICCT